MSEKDTGKDLEDIGEAIFKIGTTLEGCTREEAQEILRKVAKQLGISIGSVSFLKCEGCGREEEKSPWPMGWTQCGKSKYHGIMGNKMQIASWCPDCREEP